MSPDEAMADLVDRCKQAQADLSAQANRQGNLFARGRLSGKAEGVGLVLDYIRYTRGVMAE